MPFPSLGAHFYISKNITETARESVPLACFRFVQKRGEISRFGTRRQGGEARFNTVYGIFVGRLRAKG